MGLCLTKPRSEIGPILGKPYVDITTIYDLDKELGRGRFGITYLCIEKATGLKYACKSISSQKLVNEKEIENVRREILILEHLTGQPNIVEFKCAYEDKQNVHLVMELCSGGQLLDRIRAKGSYSEREAASVCRQIVNVVHVCHFMGVMHRDLKPENLLLVSGDENSPLKATDFGISDFIEECKVYKDFFGSIPYVAPEVFQQNYGKEVDVWSAGVILYILLSGVSPFLAGTQKGIIEAILKGKLNLQCSPWPSISASAKDLIKKMLTMDPKKRINAAEALEHPWLKEDGEADTASSNKGAAANGTYDAATTGKGTSSSSTEAAVVDATPVPSGKRFRRASRTLRDCLQLVKVVRSCNEMFFFSLACNEML